MREEDKIEEYYNYRRKNISDIVNDVVAVPDPIAAEDYGMIRGLCRYGFVSPFLDDDNKKYDKLDYEGSTIPSKENNRNQTSFYKGKVLCGYDSKLWKTTIVDDTYVKKPGKKDCATVAKLLHSN